ncbi:MAG: hypothetical protein AAF891_03255 [Pseudomonadota bacterium]
MTARIQTPFLPIYDARNACFRAVIEVTDGSYVHQYYCRLDDTDVVSGNDIYDGLKAQALFLHNASHESADLIQKLAA